MPRVVGVGWPLPPPRVSATPRARSWAATAEEDREEREDVQSVVKLRTEGTLEMGVTGNGVSAHGFKETYLTCQLLYHRVKRGVVYRPIPQRARLDQPLDRLGLPSHRPRITIQAMEIGGHYDWCSCTPNAATLSLIHRQSPTVCTHIKIDMNTSGEIESSPT